MGLNIQMYGFLRENLRDYFEEDLRGMTSLKKIPDMMTI